MSDSALVRLMSWRSSTAWATGPLPPYAAEARSSAARLADGSRAARGRALATGGARLLFADMHPNVRWNEGELSIAEMIGEHTVTAGGRGLLLMPSIFAVKPVPPLDPGEPPSLAYPSRGVGTLWAPPPRPDPAALVDLLGRTRASARSGRHGLWGWPVTRPCGHLGRSGDHTGDILCACAESRRLKSAALQPLPHAAGGTRTHDRRIKSPLLYQLSYSGGPLMIAHRPCGASRPQTDATSSISTIIRGSIRALTCTIVINGRWSPNTSPWARPTSPLREMSVT